MPAATTKEIATILIVDHDNRGRERLCRSFEEAGYRALGAEDAPSALRLLHQDPFDLIVLDLSSFPSSVSVHSSQISSKH